MCILFMVLINNIKNKIFDYIPEKKCPVCQKKMNKLVKKVYCSFLSDNFYIIDSSIFIYIQWDNSGCFFP